MCNIYAFICNLQLETSQRKINQFTNNTEAVNLLVALLSQLQFCSFFKMQVVNCWCCCELKRWWYVNVSRQHLYYVRPGGILVSVKYFMGVIGKCVLLKLYHKILSHLPYLEVCLVLCVQLRRSSLWQGFMSCVNLHICANHSGHFELMLGKMWLLTWMLCFLPRSVRVYCSLLFVVAPLRSGCHHSSLLLSPGWLL